jgi:mannose-1-phosphate guanylyltransferase/mannose-1-phosphate guanylyltransferase/mannose-6-phosphate isomerase
MADTREPTERRPWGAFYVLDEGAGFKVKRIVVTPQGRLSLQSHKHRSEHWTVVSGEATVTVGEAVQTLTRGESVDIPQGFVHRLENFGDRDAELIEVQFGDYLGEDDIVRYDDIYQRS